jgi:hypothetical protein
LARKAFSLGVGAICGEEGAHHLVGVALAAFHEDHAGFVDRLRALVSL